MEASNGTQPEPHGRRFWRTVVVIVLSLFYIVQTAPDIILAWHPTAEFGFQCDAEGAVVDVVPGSPGARAGILVGDAIDVRATPIESRRYLASTTPNVAKDGAAAHFVVTGVRGTRSVDLVARVKPRSLADNVTNAILVLAELSLLAISAPLLLSRPSWMTWTFFFYCLSNGGASVTDIAIFPLYPLIALFALGALYTISSFWLTLFALRFPSGKAVGWRRGAERALLLALPILIPFSVWQTIGVFFAIEPSAAMLALNAWLQIAGMFCAVSAFVLTYVRASPFDRARIRWVMLGLVLGLGGIYSYQLTSTVPGIGFVWPLWLLNLVQSAQLLVAMTVAYAIVRHRIFDVRFFVGRAVIYGMLTTVVVATLALVDFAAGKLLSGTGLAAVGEAGVAVLVGLSLNGVHKKLENVVDTTLFRTRIEAQRRLRRVGQGLGHATTLESIARIVVHEPVEAFQLTSAAVFDVDPTGRYVRGISVGWESASLDGIERNDPLVLQLLASREPLPIRDITLPIGSLPPGAEKPTYVMPMLVRSELNSIVFYGPHESQEELDPSEIETLEALLAAASSAHDHVAAERSQTKLAALEMQLRELRALLPTENPFLRYERADG